MVWCWEWVIVQVHLLWWPNGKTGHSGIYTLYVTPESKFSLALINVSNQFEPFFILLLDSAVVRRMQRLSLQRHICHPYEWHIRFLLWHILVIDNSNIIYIYICMCMCVVQCTYRHIGDLGFATCLPYIGPPYTTGKRMYLEGIISNIQLNHVAREQLQIVFPSNHRNCQLISCLAKYFVAI